MSTLARLALRSSFALSLLAPTGPLASQVARIPFEMHRNKVLVPVTINGQGPFRFILDTGSPVTVVNSFALARAIGIEPGDPVAIGGAGGGVQPSAARLGQVSVGIGSVGLGSDFGIVIELLDELAENSGLEYQGILGRRLFERYVVRFDFGARELALYEPANYRMPDGAQPLPMRIENGHPHIDTEVVLADGNRVTLDLVVDTGARLALALDLNPSLGIAAPDGAPETVMGRGARGTLTGRIGVVNALELGGARATQISTAFLDDTLGVSPGADGNLGIEVLRRFDVTFDYSRSQVLFQPSTRALEPYWIDLSGISLKAGGPGWHEISIASIRDDSPAQRAGLVVGDRIVTIDQETQTSLESVEERFTRPGRLRVDLLRGGQSLQVDLQLP